MLNTNRRMRKVELEKLMGVRKQTIPTEITEESVRDMLNQNQTIGMFRAVQGLGQLMDKTKVPAKATSEFNQLRSGLMQERDFYEKLLLGRK